MDTIYPNLFVIAQKNLIGIEIQDMFIFLHYIRIYIHNYIHTI